MQHHELSWSASTVVRDRPLLETQEIPAADAEPVVSLRDPDSPAAQYGVGLRVAIVHEWLDNYAGSERVLEQLIRCYPQADVFAVVDFLPPQQRSFLLGKKVHTTFIQNLPLSRRMFRNYLGLMPLAIQQLDLSHYDLVISSNHAVAKGVLTGPEQLHVSYVHSPMRYAWDLQHQYLAQSGLGWGPRGAYTRWLLTRLRQWDVCSAAGVDHFIANSTYIAGRIGKAYRRNSTVIHPPVDISRFAYCDVKQDFYLLACRFVPYKRADLVVESFARRPDRRLIVVGDGPDRARVREAARNATNIEFKGVVPQGELVRLMQQARAFVFAGKEDFGITLVEAQACGTPVVAYGWGGSRDIVIPPEEPDPTGLFFDRQDADAISQALDELDRFGCMITSEACRMNAERFSESRFRAEFGAFVDRALDQSR